MLIGRLMGRGLGEDMLSKQILHKSALAAAALKATVMATLTAGTLLLGAIPTLAQASQPIRGQISQNPISQNRNSISQSVPRTVAAGLSDRSRAGYQTIFVDAAAGSDAARGLEGQPLRTVTRALEIASPNTVIVLAPGRYTQATGEVFPLQMKSGVTIQGAPGSRDRTAIIEGGGNFESLTRSQQNATILAADRAGIAQIAVSNPNGYGVWVESASPTILETAFVGSRQAGLYVVNGSPRVQGSYFSGNQVAGVIVLGVSSASIQSNIFDGTGDAMRVMDGATPEIIGNRMTNNDAGLVLIGSALPVFRDNQVTGNRRNDVVEVAASAQNILASAISPEAETAVSAPLTEHPVAINDSVNSSNPSIRPSIRPSISSTLVSAPVNQMASRSLPSLPVVQTRSEEIADLPPVSSPQQMASDPTVEADAVAGSNQIPDGAPGAALQALRSGLSTANSQDNSQNPSQLIARDIPGPRILTDDQDPNNDSNHNVPSDLPAARPLAPSQPPINSAPVNVNRLSVPNASIPLGSGESNTAFLAPANSIGGGGQSYPSRAQALGLHYRVFVEASDPVMQDQVRAVVSDAFRTNFEGRMMMQVGAFPTEDEAQARKQLLEDNNFNVRVEYLP